MNNKTKNKFWIKIRVFLSFTLFIIIVVNIFVYFLYLFVISNIEKNIKTSIYNEYETITTFIDLQKTNIFSLPKYELEKLNNLWFYFYIWNNDLNLQKKHNLWFKKDENKVVFRWDYRWYNIIIWKITNDLKNLKKEFINIVLLLNIFLILTIFILSYYITKQSLKPLFNLTKALYNYNYSNNKQKLINNNYWNTEIWKLIDSINNFIKNNNKILENQKKFIQDVSHELKTPLMQIESNIELIEDKITQEKIKIKLKQIKSSTEDISNIVSNLWFILRWEEIIKVKQEINLYKYFQELIKKYIELAKNKNIEIKLIKNSELIVKNNSYYLDRLFWNIISNSIFYNDWNNEIKIIIWEKSIEIIDEWIWIEPEEINKIFDRFYRNKNSNLYYNSWNWLGLVIVKKISNLFWWELKIESKKWKWTKILIKIK